MKIRVLSILFSGILSSFSAAAFAMDPYWLETFAYMHRFDNVATKTTQWVDPVSLQQKALLEDYPVPPFHLWLDGPEVGMNGSEPYRKSPTPNPFFFFDFLETQLFNFPRDGYKIDAGIGRPNADKQRRRDNLVAIATRCELKGEWREAIFVYAVLYGLRDDDYYWALARILNATEDRELAFELLWGLIEKNATLYSVERTLEKLTSEKIVRSENGAVYVDRRTKTLDMDWYGIYRLRDLCARVVCPDLYWSVPCEPGDDPTIVQKKFDDWRHKKYAEFLQVAEEEFKKRQNNNKFKFSWTPVGTYNREREYKPYFVELPEAQPLSVERIGWAMEFLRELARLP